MGQFSGHGEVWTELFLSADKVRTGEHSVMRIRIIYKKKREDSFEICSDFEFKWNYNLHGGC